MKQWLYRILYHEKINPVLRGINRLLLPILPERLRLSPSGTLVLPGTAGGAVRLKTNQTSYLSHLIYWHGHQQFDYTDLFIKLIKQVDTFYDIGANIGYYSLLAALENARIQVVGFEPAAGPLHYFRENVRLNGFENIRVEALALAASAGDLVFHEVRNAKYPYLEHNLGGESNAGSRTTQHQYVERVVPAMTLDGYVAAHETRAIDLIKIDTEGTEHQILAHARQVLHEMQPIVICETLFDTNEAELEAVMGAAGYEFFYHADGGLRKQPTLVREADDGVRDCFFVHPSKYHLVAPFVVA